VRVALVLAFVSLACCAPARAGADDAEPTAAELAARAAERAFGANAIEVWKSEWQDSELTFGVARRWRNGELAVLLHVLTPHKYDELGFLFRARASGLPAIEYFRSPKLFGVDQRSGRTLDIQVASPIERLPFAPGLPALADLWPPRASDFQVTRLADAQVDGKPCRVFEQRLRRSDGAYDRIVTSLSRDSNLALDTQYLRGKRLVRRVTVASTDVDRSDAERPVVRRRSIERPGEATQVLTLERFSPDPVFPDQLFTSSNLRTGRFPSY
jgi:hypothetical protein